MADSADKLISVFVDGIEVKVAPGTNMIEAALKAGVEVPHYCYHSHLSVAGNCRMCLVEMGMPGMDRATRQPILDADGKPVIQWMPKPTIACATNASPGLHIRTTTKLVKECREGIMEFLLVNHPLDCPICDQAGECHLQEYATDYGRGYSRYVEEKNVKPKRTMIGPRVILDDERCILCGRCVRFCQEVAKDEVLGFTERGSHTTLTCFPGRTLDNNYSLNVVDICPVGALTSTDFRFKMRVWFLKETPSICTESSVGVNTTVWSREGTIYRITPRRNDAVNDSWMSDTGRMLYKQVASEHRSTDYTIEGKPVPSGEALKAMTDIVRSAKGLAVIGSGTASVEEQWLLRKIADAAPAGFKVKFIVPRPGEGDGMLISADGNPNTRGALVTGLIDKLDQCDCESLKAAVDAGTVDTLIACNECISCAEIGRDDLKKLRFVCMGSHFCESSQYANIEVPLLTVFEKTGSFINQQFRLQKFAQAVPGPAGVMNDIAFLSALLTALGGKAPKSATPEGVWELMSREIPQLSGISFATIPADGLPLDGSAFAAQPFVEGKSLHYDPAGA
ncbi:MAG: 2Fe-2S iron-sulfur cluster-binding protein [Opitutales bacterium]|jgi:NADH-quinone oxidoreductase subunit G